VPWGSAPILSPREPGGPATRVRVAQPALRVGRDPSCDVVISEPTVSRRHAKLTWDGKELVVEDLGSSGGTFVNEQRVQRATIQPGDVLRLGPRTEYVVQLEATSTPLEVAAQSTGGGGEAGVRHLQMLLDVARALNAATVLEEVKMGEWAHQKVGRFSKGMKQRVNIAASLLSDPDVVILDEPSTGLDPRGMAEVRNIVRGLKKENRLVFMSSHILSEVVDVCDEVALINRGKLLFYDTLANVSKRLTATSTSVELSFLGPVSEEVLSAQVGSVPGVTSVSRVGPQRARVTIAGGPEAQARVLEQVAAARLGLISFEPSQSALEEVYLQEISRGD